jgi:phosphate:Na+ symporter
LVIPSIVLLNIIAAVCLLLWGVTLLRLGVTRGFGGNLHRFLSLCTNNRVKAFGAGLAMTTLLQSSMATTLIVTAFAGQGLVTASTGLAIILGADVGTTLVAQLFSMNITILTPVMMVAGYIFYSIENSGRIKNIGRVFIGLAFMLMALTWIREAAEPLKESKVLPLILAPLDKDPFFAVLLAALFTWIAHSSLAIVLLMMSLVASGVLPFTLGLYMVLGANIGGTIAPLIATLRDNPDVMRIPLGNMLIRCMGVLLCVPIIHFIPPYLDMWDDDKARQLVDFHMAFNIALALLFLPFTGVLNRLLIKALPDRPQADNPKKAKYLNEKDLVIPSVALTAAARETLRMADYIQEMLEDTLKVFKTNDEKLLAKIKEEDDTVDAIYHNVKNYMARMGQEFMDPKEAKRYVQVLMFSTNLEHIGDVIDKNLMPLAQKKIRNQHNFSKEGFKEIEHIHRLVCESVQLAQSLFISNDLDSARRLMESKEIIRKAEIDGMATHIDRLRGAVPETIATSSLHLDIIRDYRRINTYVCTVAEQVIEEKSNVSQSRAAQKEETVHGDLHSNT